ncbi:MAG: hypothetical protein JW818_17540 [Pirellulales bacterium]|nr:hypothetical protein [Pirellulales bacterium]
MTGDLLEQDVAEPSADAGRLIPECSPARPWPSPEGCVEENAPQADSGLENRGSDSSPAGRVGSGDGWPRQPSCRRVARWSVSSHRALRVLLCKWVV